MNCYLKFCSYPGSTPLHLAARGGSLDCIRELLAWGADRIQRDSSGYGLILRLVNISKHNSSSFMWLIGLYMDYLC